ncbi:MAG: hypothetical protein A4E34_01249 [Methanoregula sp. PtaU1.Bin006]|nr:MAG: hypothetical protein A4E33_01184 [Methanoregula sp. PtaB.Bin085]OPY34721.1 MAG: hypothetical protein A4E34_01249 [Methanoregula sp. PtaU1.Bin006]
MPALTFFTGVFSIPRNASAVREPVRLDLPCTTAGYPSGCESRGERKKSMLFPDLFLLLFLLLSLDLGEELIELLLPVCGHEGIDLDEVLGDLA